MADSATERQIFTELDGLVSLLCDGVIVMEQRIEKPRFIDADKPDKRFRFNNPNPLVLQVLMCVRIASGLRACLILLRNYHTSEVAALLRTIDDFVGDIWFVDEVIEKGEATTVAQNKFLEQYFVDEKLDPNETKKVDLGRRQKVQASEARTLGGDNPDRVKKIVKPIDDVLSGAVHGSYSSVMEMYGGDGPESLSFHTRGIPARFSEYRHFVGLIIHEALNTFCKVAYNLGDHELANTLREARRAFEKSPAYTTH